ncbi:MAG: glycosyltransferase [Oscillospiraceae bacterium]|nr:glycosyltransferase [Oscillospiraceae bacterium]
MPLISVIVPVYKVEKYLRKCIESIIGQKYTNLEIILADDGSPDSSGKICDEYAKRDNRIIVIHKENGGVGSARNAGIDRAAGEYIAFVDGDDHVSELYISRLYEILEESGASLSVCNSLIEKNGRHSVHYPYKMDGIFSSELLIEKILNFEMGCGVVGKLFKRTALNGVRFSEFTIAEDLLFLFRVLERNENVAVCSDCLYYYVMNPSSAINSSFKYSKYESLKVYDIILEAAKGKSYYPRAEARLVRGNFQILMMISRKSFADEYEAICRKIKLHRKNVMLDKNGSLKTRMACALSYLGFGTVKAVFKLLKKK